MFRKSATSILVLAALTAAGCATIPETDPALEDARMAVGNARGNPLVATYAPSELDQAIATLNQANDLAARGARASEVDPIAMLASQRANLAQEAARARSAEAALMDRRRAADAQLTADMSRRQAASAQNQANDAQRQAEDSQRLASSMQSRADAHSMGTDYRKRQNEPLYEARVDRVRAVVGPSQQRCWISREQVRDPGTSGVNLPGAIIGGAIGGIIGHQIGGGHGQDVATGVGVVAGAAIGANAGRTPDRVEYTQDVRRCDYAPSAAGLSYWDVTYTYAGYEHRVQMTTPPGPTIWVNAQGEPRV